MVCLAILAGCGGEPAEVLWPVKGRITFDGKPLPKGSVSLRPDGSSEKWYQPTGSITDGEYVIYTDGREGAPLGAYRVVVFSTDAQAAPGGDAHPGMPRSAIPAKYNLPEQTPLRVTVIEKPAAGAYDLELRSP